MVYAHSTIEGHTDGTDGRRCTDSVGRVAPNIQRPQPKLGALEELLLSMGTAGSAPFRVSRGSSMLAWTEPHTEGAGRCPVSLVV